MTYTSSLNTVHKQGLFGDHENKKENDKVELKLDEIVTPEPPPFEEDTTAKKRTYVFGP